MSPSNPIAVTQSIGCGPRALATLLALIGEPANEKELAVLSGMDENGLTSMYGLSQAVKAKGFEAVGYQLDLEEFSQMPLPLIAHVNGNHFVVVSAYEPPYLTVIDNNRKSKMMVSDFEQIWNGLVLVVQGKQNGQ
jgi:ATP-binding cassette subfamily B protein